MKGSAHGPVNEGKKGKGASVACLGAAGDLMGGIMWRGKEGVTLPT